MEHPLSQFKYCPKCGSAHFEVHNEKSKQCADCGFVYYFNPSSATVALILNERDELLYSEPEVDFTDEAAVAAMTKEAEKK